MARKLIVEIIGDSSSLQRSFRQSSNGARNFERDLGKATRGALAGSGVFRTLGRSLAFASGGFLAFASASELIRGSIQQATQRAATEKQLAAQFAASGLELRRYSRWIDEATTSLSRLAGIEDDELKRAFTTAFRGSQNVSAALRIQATAADVARGTGKELGVVTIALTKAFLGQNTALRRLGIQVPATLKGLAAIEFVARRFEGQARAGTTAQQRFTAAFKNFQEVIGLALLPEFNRLLDTATEWLSNEKNQRQVGKALADGMTALAASLRLVGRYLRLDAELAHPLIDSLRTLDGLGKKLTGTYEKLGGSTKLLGKAFRDAAEALPGGAGLLAVLDSLRRGSDKALGPGQSPIGENALGGGGAGQGSTTAAGRRRTGTGLRAQFVRTQLELAKAQITASTADDRRVLQEQAKILRAAIRQTTNLKKRTELYQQLGTVESQIQAIDAKAATIAKDARQKEIDARRKELEARQQQLSKLKAQESALKSKLESIRSQFKAAVDTAREAIGQLFAGPVLQPTDEARKHLLGVGRPLSQDPKALTRDLKAQTAQFAAFQRDLNRLAKRGAPAELIRELRAQGLAAAPEAHALATAGGSMLKEFFKAFGKREKLAIQSAKTEMRSQLVTLHATRVRLQNVQLREEIVIHNIVTLDGKKVAENTTKHQTRRDKSNAASRRGRNAGRG